MVQTRQVVASRCLSIRTYMGITAGQRVVEATDSG